MSFRLTYATMFNPPEEMHERFEKALVTVRGRLGADARDVRRRQGCSRRRDRGAREPDRQPDQDRPFPAREREGSGCARSPRRERAFPAWRDAGMAKRVPLMRKVARPHRGARVRDRGRARARGRQEPPRGARRGAGERGFLRRLRRRLRIPQGLRVRPAERSVDRLRFAQQERDAPLRRLGRDRALQFPARARRRPDRRRARHRQHGRRSSAPPTRPGPGACSPTASATRACPPACSTM